MLNQKQFIVMIQWHRVASFRCGRFISLCRFMHAIVARIAVHVLLLYQYTLILFFQTGEETFFKIKKSTKMSKVFETYAQRKGVQSSSLRFLLDGERIDGDNTPKMLELDDQDQIDCMLEQT